MYTLVGIKQLSFLNYILNHFYSSTILILSLPTPIIVVYNAFFAPVAAPNKSLIKL